MYPFHPQIRNKHSRQFCAIWHFAKFPPVKAITELMLKTHFDLQFSVFLPLLSLPSLSTYIHTLSLTHTQVTWFLNGEQLRRSVQATPLPNGSLYLHPPLPHGEHQVTCHATSELGTVIAHTTITVTDNSSSQ